MYNGEGRVVGWKRSRNFIKKKKKMRQWNSWLFDLFRVFEKKIEKINENGGANKRNGIKLKFQGEIKYLYKNLDSL